MAYSKVRVFDNVVEVDVVTDTAIHAANDVVAQPIELADAVQWNGCGVITSCVVTDYDDQGSALNLIFMRSPITVGANNATIAVSDGEVGEILGHVSVAAADYLNMANNQVATWWCQRPTPAIVTGQSGWQCPQRERRPMPAQG